jgi:hypothetical protein
MTVFGRRLDAKPLLYMCGAALCCSPHWMQKLFMHWLLSCGMAKQVQTVVTTPANSKCVLVILYVLFVPVRFFELAVFPLTF